MKLTKFSKLSKSQILPTSIHKFQVSGFKEKGRFLCRFCGGKACKNENYLFNKKAVIEGLNSD